jgi:aldehyde dehydrogenase family 7 protein A1
LCGPLHSKHAVSQYQKGLEEVVAQKGKILYGGKVLEQPGNYVMPTITQISASADVVQNEYFVPVFINAIYLLPIRFFTHLNSKYALRVIMLLIIIDY